MEELSFSSLSGSCSCDGDGEECSPPLAVMPLMIGWERWCDLGDEEGEEWSITFSWIIGGGSIGLLSAVNHCQYNHLILYKREGT